MIMKILMNIKKWWYNRGKVTVPPPVTAPQEPAPQVPHVGNKELWYPKAVKGGSMKTQGEYRKGYPEGAIVHFTAGHCETEQEAKDSLSWGIGEGYTFFVIGPTGVVYQNFPLNRWGHHAGVSSWPSLGSSVSKYLVGIEVACAGKVSAAGKSWFGKTYSASRLRISPKKDNIQAGSYVKYTEAQEIALIELLTWLKKNNPDVFKVDQILGHDEVAPTRRDDPGASLSMSMPEFREHIREMVR